MYLYRILYAEYYIGWQSQMRRFKLIFEFGLGKGVRHIVELSPDLMDLSIPVAFEHYVSRPFQKMN